MNRIIRSTMKRMTVFIGSMRSLQKNEKNVLFGGRLGQYKYYDMDKVIAVIKT